MVVMSGMATGVTVLNLPDTAVSRTVIVYKKYSIFLFITAAKLFKRFLLGSCGSVVGKE